MPPSSAPSGRRILRSTTLHLFTATLHGSPTRRRRTSRSSRSTRRFRRSAEHALVELPVAHDDRQPLSTGTEHGNVLKRIPVHDQEIRGGTLTDTSKATRLTDHFRIDGA